MKRTVAILMALLLAMSVMLIPVAASSEVAAEQTNITIDETDEQQEDQPVLVVSESDDEQSFSAVVETEVDPVDVESNATYEPSEEAETASVDSTDASLEPQTGSDEIDTDPILDGASADDPNAASWVTAKQRTIYLNLELNALIYDVEHLPLATFLDLLAEQNEEFSVPDESAVVAWGGTGYNDEYHIIARSDTVDAGYPYYSMNSGETYRISMIVGSGHQLNREDIKYYINVEQTGSVTVDDMKFTVYKQDNAGNRTFISDESEPGSGRYSYSEDDVKTVYKDCEVALGDGESLYLGTTSYLVSKNLGVSVKAYDADGTDITNQILDQTMTNVGAGYLVPCVNGTEVADLRFVYSYNGEAIDSYSVHFENNQVYISIWVDDIRASASEGYGDWIDYRSNWDTADDAVNSYTVYMTDKHPMGSEVYVSLTANSTAMNTDGLTHVEKAVVGNYDTLTAASGQSDIKDKLFGEGYGITSGSSPVFITVFTTGTTNNQNVWKFRFNFSTYENTNINFRVTGAKDQDGNYIDTTYDILYRDDMSEYYQTIFVLDPDTDLSKIRPIFSLQDGCRAHIRSEIQTSGETLVDFSGGMVQYQVDIPGIGVRNYFVQFVKMNTDGAKLLVSAPTDEREIFLIDYFDEQHEISIANIGDKVLTGLNVRLENAQNVALDEYYTVGGEGNDRLDTSADDTEYSWNPYNYNSNGNAVIRLVPDGQGEIKGTLVISADGQDDVRLQLTGFAKDPVITTTELDDAVKYVPYSFLVATNSIYEWIDVNFTLSRDSVLPEGMYFYPKTGEIYGVAQETGEFPITVTASFKSTSDLYPFTFNSCTYSFVLTVKENTNENVYNETDAGYAILDSIGVETEEGSHDFLLTNLDDQTFRSEGELSQFVDLWLNGEKLVRGVDYSAESGSTKVVIYDQTFENKATQDGYNTLAAEFRVLDPTSLNDENNGNDLRTTAQNFRIDLSANSGGTSGGGTSGGGTSGGGTSGGGTSGRTTSGGGNNSNQSSSITANFTFTDVSGAPAPGLSIELRSTPRKATTNIGGVASFSGVEMGDHTISVLDESGKAVASKTFKLISGSKLSVSGDTFTVVNGSTVSFPVTYDGSTLTFGSAVQESEPETGDASMLEIYIATLFTLLAGAGWMLASRRRYCKNEGR